MVQARVINNEVSEVLMNCSLFSLARDIYLLLPFSVPLVSQSNNVNIVTKRDTHTHTHSLSLSFSISLSASLPLSLTYTYALTQGAPRCPLIGEAHPSSSSMFRGGFPSAPVPFASTEREKKEGGQKERKGGKQNTEQQNNRAKERQQCQQLQNDKP